VSAELLQSAIRRLAFGNSLTAAEASAAFGVIMRGEATPAQAGALLLGLRVKGENAEEVAGSAQALREAMIHLPANAPEELVDTCGTGGGTVTTFNISTAAALVASGAGVRIAKHGNRSFTSRCGSADVLEALGVRIDLPVARMAAVLDEAGIVFMFAPLMHPAMRHVGPIRRELAVPTVMNIVGPLANPAGAARQVIGVADAARVELIADALASLGTLHAMVVHGEPGLDEISPIGTTRVVEIRDGKRSEWIIDPAEHGCASTDPAELAGGGPDDNARIISEVLAGGGTRAASDAVALNAGAALYVSGAVGSFGKGVVRAREALASGEGELALDRLRSATAETSATQ
jgi:anthranilate phosphoribosyltransferase